MSINKQTKEGDNIKRKCKAPAYKLQFNIESLVDLKGILEENFLNAKIEFTMRKLLVLPRKDFMSLTLM